MEHNLPYDERLIFTPDPSHALEASYKSVLEILKLKPRPTAIFAANDEMAFGVMNMADRMSLKVPDDLSVVGFGGSLFAAFAIPSLATIQGPTLEMASLATEKLLAFINEGAEAARAFGTTVAPTYVPRNSTGPAPDA